MKHPLNLLLYPIFFLLFLSSCEYENSGLYEPKVNKDIAPPDIQVVRLDLEEDTLFLYESKQINFRFQSNATQKIVAVKFYLDNVLLSTVNADNGFFDLNYSQLIEGVHKIKIELYAKSGTGSIADKLGNEGFVLTSDKEWVIKVIRFSDSDYNNRIEFSNSNGFLKLKWPISNDQNCKEYKIYKWNGFIKTTTINEYVDSAYIGENEIYTIEILTKTESTYTWAKSEKKSESTEGIKTTIANGFLKLTFSNNTYKNLKEFQIFKSSIIKKTISNEFIDSSYIGEGGYYNINAVSKNGKSVFWGETSINYEMNKPVFEYPETNQGKIIWRKSKFFNALKSYDLYQYNSSSNSEVLVKTTQNTNDTSYIIDNTNFGDIILFKLKIIPKISNFYNNISLSSDSRYFGFTFANYSYSLSFVDVVSKTEFIYNYSGSLYKYSVSERNIVNQIINNTYDTYIGYANISPSKKYITGYVNNKAVLINTQNFNFEHIQDLKHLIDPNSKAEIPISDIGTGILNTHFDYDKNGFYIYDFNNNSVIAKFETNNSDIGKGSKISNNGDFIYLQKHDSLKYVKLENSSFRTIWKKRFAYPDYNFLDFDAVEPNRLVYCDGAKLYIKKCDDFSTIIEFPLPDEEILNIDYYNNELLTFSSGHLYVRSLLDGVLIKDIPINFNILSNYNWCYLVDHTIVLPDKKIMYFVN